ncbi:MAG: hypothetical protein RIG62_09885 [Cyclobacteriaceae bacterium]
MKYSYADRLERARLVIEGALANTNITKKTALYGFDRKACQQAHLLYEAAYGLQVTKDGELGAQRDTTQARRKAQQEAHQLYMMHVKIVRMAVPKEEELWKKLGLTGKRDTSLTGWLTQVNRFYQNVSQVQEVLAQFNVSPEALQQAQAKVEAVAAMRVDQNRTRSQSQQLREQRDAALHKLEKWVRHFRKIAEIAFEDNPQQLEALGMAVPSGK